MPKSCWAVGCNHTSSRETCKMFRFPTDVDQLRKWLKLLRRGDAQPTFNSRICSCHFRDGLKANGPEIFAHNVAKHFEEHHLTPEKKEKRQRRIHLELGEASTSASTSMEQTVEPVSTVTPMETSSDAVLEASNYLLEMELQKKDVMMRKLQIHFTFDHIRENDEMILEYTGLPSKHVFESLAELLGDIEMYPYAKWKVLKLTRTDQLLMTLMKLRRNFTHKDLAFRFQVSVATVTNIVVTYIHLLHEVLYKQLMATIPKRSKNRSCLPNCCSSFTNCRIILDCTEVYTTVSRKSLKLQRDTYSAYKHRNTWKGLIGVAPNGVITFASSLYPGSTSDKKIVQASDILKQMEPGDLILADKGFLINDILPAGVSLNIPPFLVTPQFNPEQVRRTESIARARIHVERAIQRMKCYAILELIPLAYFSYGSIIFKAIAALTNLQYPLIREVSQYYGE